MNPDTDADDGVAKYAGTLPFYIARRPGRQSAAVATPCQVKPHAFPGFSGFHLVVILFTDSGYADYECGGRPRFVAVTEDAMRKLEC
jgi:hypothetical protein